MESTETISQSPRRRASREGRVRLARGGDPDQGDRGQALGHRDAHPVPGPRRRPPRAGPRGGGDGRPSPSTAGQRARAPGAGGPAAAKWTSFPWRVRPVSIASSRRLTPSTSTSSQRPDPGLVAGQGGAVDHRLEPLEALGDDLGRARSSDSMAAARVPGPRREDEGEGAVVAGLGAHGQRVLEVLVGLAGEADDDVGRHGQVVDRRPGPRPAAPGSAAPCSPRRMARSTRSLPDCSGRWSCSHTSGVSAMASIVSGRRSLGCGLVKRTRPIPSTAPTARSSVGEERAGAA